MKKGRIPCIVSVIAGMACGVILTGKKAAVKIRGIRKTADRYSALYSMMVRWVEVKQKGRSFTWYFKHRKYDKIAIYGMGRAGEVLADELEGSGVQIRYAIDRRPDYIYAEFPVVSVEDIPEKVDVIVVTAIQDFDEIRDLLSRKVDCPVVSLEKIVESCRELICTEDISDHEQNVVYRSR